MHDYKVIIILFFLIISGCKSESASRSFYEKTNLRWMAGTHLKWITDHYKQDEKIKTPAGTWQAILEVEFIDRDLKHVSDCLFYRVPSSDKTGQIKVVANRSSMPCSEIFAQEGYSKIKDVFNFGFFYEQKLKSTENLTLKIDTQRLTYDFLNMTHNKYGTKLLDASVKKRKFKASIISSPLSYKVRYPSLKVGDICFDVDEKCKISLKNKCHHCPFGSFQVVAHGCTEDFTRICGMDRCGEKNQVACPRGFLATGLKPKNYCVNDSPAGICQKGLRVICQNGTLVCE